MTPKVAKQILLNHYFSVYVNPVLGLIVRAEIYYDTGFTFCKIFIFGFIEKSHKLYVESWIKMTEYDDDDGGLWDAGGDEEMAEGARI